MIVNDTDLFSPKVIQNPFDAIKEVDAEWREWWNSRRLAQPNTKSSGGQDKTIRFDFDKLTEGLE